MTGLITPELAQTISQLQQGGSYKPVDSNFLNQLMSVPPIVQQMMQRRGGGSVSIPRRTKSYENELKSGASELLSIYKSGKPVDMETIVAVSEKHGTPVKELGALWVNFENHLWAQKQRTRQQQEWTASDQAAQGKMQRLESLGQDYETQALSSSREGPTVEAERMARLVGNSARLGELDEARQLLSGMKGKEVAPQWKYYYNTRTNQSLKIDENSQEPPSGPEWIPENKRGGETQPTTWKTLTPEFRGKIAGEFYENRRMPGATYAQNPKEYAAERGIIPEYKGFANRTSLINSYIDAQARRGKKIDPLVAEQTINNLISDAQEQGVPIEALLYPKAEELKPEPEPTPSETGGAPGMQWGKAGKQAVNEITELVNSLIESWKSAPRTEEPMPLPDPLQPTSRPPSVIESIRQEPQNVMSDPWGDTIIPGRGNPVNWSDLPLKDRMEDIEQLKQGKRSFGPQKDQVFLDALKKSDGDVRRAAEAVTNKMLSKQLPEMWMWESNE